MERPSVVIAEVEDFIKHYDSGELVLTLEAKKMTFIEDLGRNFLGLPKKRKRPFPDCLAHAMTAYKLDKDIKPRSRLESAYDLLDLIQRGRAYGIIRDPKQQAIAYEQEIERLKEQIGNLKNLNDKLTMENKRLHNLVPNKTKGQGDTEIGDVGH